MNDKIKELLELIEANPNLRVLARSVGARLCG